MKSTPYYGFAYPEGPDHTRTWEYWKATAEQVEAKLRGGYRIPDGNLYLGDPAIAQSRQLYMDRLVAPDAYQGRIGLAGDGNLYIWLLKNGVEVNRLRFTPSGAIYQGLASEIGTRPIPYATQVGVSNVVTSAVQASVTVTYSANRFNSAPYVQVTSSDQYWNWAATTHTATGFTAWCRQIDGAASANYSINGFWHATQMFGGAGGGPGLVAATGEPDTVAVVAICHTAECENGDVALTIHVPLVEGQDPLESNVQCGVCGQPITDLALA